LRAIFLHTLIILGHFLKQTQNPFKKYFPHTDQQLIGVEPRVWKECGRSVEETAKFAWFLSKFMQFLAAKNT
jgi:hypothetical protein